MLSLVDIEYKIRTSGIIPYRTEAFHSIILRTFSYISWMNVLMRIESRSSLIQSFLEAYIQDWFLCIFTWIQCLFNSEANYRFHFNQTFDSFYLLARFLRVFWLVFLVFKSLFLLCKSLLSVIKQIKLFCIMIVESSVFFVEFLLCVIN